MSVVNLIFFRPTVLEKALKLTKNQKRPKKTIRFKSLLLKKLSKKIASCDRNQTFKDNRQTQFNTVMQKSGSLSENF